MPPTTIRFGTESDQDALADLSRVVQNDHATAYPHIFRAGVAPLAGTYLAGLLQDDASGVLVAEREGEVTGCVVVTLRQAPPYPVFQRRTFAVVSVLVVAESERGRGVGRLLMDAAIRWSIRHGAESLDLDVWEANDDAITFYRHLGMQTTRRIMTLPLDVESPPTGEASESADCALPMALDAGNDAQQR